MVLVFVCCESEPRVCLRRLYTDLEICFTCVRNRVMSSNLKQMNNKFDARSAFKCCTSQLAHLIETILTRCAWVTAVLTQTMLVIINLEELGLLVDRLWLMQEDGESTHIKIDIIWSTTWNVWKKLNTLLLHILEHIIMLEALHYRAFVKGGAHTLQVVYPQCI